MTTTETQESVKESLGAFEAGVDVGRSQTETAILLWLSDNKDITRRDIWDKCSQISEFVKANPGADFIAFSQAMRCAAAAEVPA